MRYESTLQLASSVMPGVQFRVQRMSFGRRVELTRQIRELADRMEFLDAGESAKEKLDAALLAAEIDRTYVLWGLQQVSGLEVDGAPATPESLMSKGPEALCQEVLAAIKAECGLSDDEIKN
jgi:hypothetical protein